MEKIKERADAYMQQVYMANPKKNRARKRKSNQINWEQKKNQLLFAEIQRSKARDSSFAADGSEAYWGATTHVEVERSDGWDKNNSGKGGGRRAI
jgi:hypothetical protein